MPAKPAATGIEIIKAVDQTLVDDLRRLFGQLYPDLNPAQVESAIGEPALVKLVESPTDILLVAKTKDGQIVATATLNFVRRPTGRSAYIETFVVDQDHRGQGWGQLLLDEMVELSRRNQARIISLASSKYRLASHRLYERGGFKQNDSFYYSRQLD